MRRTGGTLILACALAATVAAPALAGPPSRRPAAADHRADERLDRATDEAALSAKYAAIKSFERLLARGNEDRKTTILLRLAETLQQAADMDYRIQFYKKKKRNPTLEEQRLGVAGVEASKLMLRSIAVLTELERMPSRRVDMGRVRYLRAVALRDVGRTAEAAQEFERFVREFPRRDEVPQARFSLVNLQREVKNYSGAAAILNTFRFADSSPFEAYRLDLLYLNYMDLNDLPNALRVVELESGRLRRLGPNARLADLERAYEHGIRAFFAAIEQKTPGISLEKLYVTLKEMNAGPALGKAILQVAQTLRVKEWREQLIYWKNLMLTYEKARPEWREVLWVLAEYELINNRSEDFKRLFAQIQEAITERMGKDIQEFKHKIEVVLLERTIFLSARVKEMSDPVSVAAVRRDLNVVYESFILFAPQNHPKVQEVRFNLAENSFKTENFALATQNYLWLVHFRANNRRLAASSVDLIPTQDLVLKAVASRYEELRTAGRIPKELRARPLAQGTDKPVESKLSAWLSWIDRLREYQAKGQSVAAASNESLDGFEFEANRVLYTEGHIRQSVDRLSSFVDRRPKSNYAVSSGVLVVDTYVLSQEWDRARTSAMRTRAILPATEKAVGDRLYDVAAEATFQLVSAGFQQKDYAKALKETDLFFRSFAKHVREKDVLAIAVQSAIGAGERDRAKGYTGQLIASHSRSAEGIDAFRLRAEFAEEDLDFASASQDLRRFLISQVASKSGDVKESVDLRKKALFLAWLSGDPAELRKTLDFQILCDKLLKPDCELFEALLAVSQNRKADKGSVAEAKEKALYGSGGDRPIWAVTYLKSDAGSKLTTDQRFRYLETIVAGWNGLDPLYQLSIYQWVQQIANQAMDIRRREIQSVAKMQAQPSWIRLRSTMLEDFEKRAQIPLQMPWARIQTGVLASLAGGYMDFINDIEKFRGTLKDLPEGDLQAINATLDELRASAKAKLMEHARRGLEVAGAGGVEEEDSLKLVRLVAQFPEDRGDVIMPPADIARVSHLNSSFMNDVEGGTDWKADNRSHPDPTLRFKGLWAWSIDHGAWAQAAYLMKVAKEKKLLSDNALGRAQAVLFDALGARTEGLPAFEFGMDQMQVQRSQRALLYMVALSVHTLSKPKTLKYLDLCEQYWRRGARFQFSGAEAKLLLYAASWAKFDLPSKMNSTLVATSKTDGKGEGG